MKTVGVVSATAAVRFASVRMPYLQLDVTGTYPVEAKKARIQGKVQLDAAIGKAGEIEQLKVISGPKELQQSALDAVRQWTYKPFLLNGEPVEVKTKITVTYTLTH